VALALASSAAALTSSNEGPRRQRLWDRRPGPSRGGRADSEATPTAPPQPPPPLLVSGAAVPDRASGQLRFEPDPAHPGALAHGAFVDARHTKSNFGKLRLVTGSADDARQRRRPHPPRPRPHSADRAEVFASGWLEGWMTAERIYDHWFNMDSYFRVQLNASMERPMAWLRRNDAWVRAAVAAAGLDDDDDNDNDDDEERGQGQQERGDDNSKQPSISDRQYWATVDLVVAQADGVAAGYAARSAHEAARAEAAREGGQARPAAAAAAAAAAAVPPLSPDDLLFLNGNGDIYEVLDMYDAIDAGELPPEQEEGDGEGLPPPARRDDATPNNDDEPLARLGPWARRKFGFPPDDGGGGGDALRIARDLELQGHCSALVKVAADLSDVFFAHSTWDSFTAMTRIYKHLDWSSLRGPSAPLAAPRVSHSGYPGEVASDDDFYLASSGLLVTEATLHVFDPRALAPLVEQRGERVLSWVRVRAATALADSGAAWVDVLARAQSGTYNNAFLVADLKRFVPSRAEHGSGNATTNASAAAAAAAAASRDDDGSGRLPGLYPGFLWLAEQLPGALPARDLTALVANGYAAAYNVPLDKRIYDAAGYPAAAAEAARVAPRDLSYATPSRYLSYQTAPRAELFRRDQGLVQSVRDAQRLMRSNAYRTDPLSGGFPVAAVCARGDLIARSDLAAPKGCYDTKVTSWGLAWDGRGDAGEERPLAAEVVGGPTLGGRLAREANDAEDPADPADGPLPPFKWTAKHREFAHRGMHEGEYRFRFERQQANEDLPLPGDGRRRRAAAAATS
jgi:hypothetical protein